MAQGLSVVRCRYLAFGIRAGHSSRCTRCARRWRYLVATVGYLAGALECLAKLLSLIRGLTRNLKSGEGDLHIEHFSCVRPAFLHFRAY